MTAAAGTAPLLTSGELARYLGVHPKTILSFVRPGRKRRRYPPLPCVRVGGRLRFKASDVDTWISARKEGE